MPDIYLHNEAPITPGMTVRQLLHLQPELMGENTVRFRFYRAAALKWHLGQLGGPGRRLKVFFRGDWFDVRVPRFDRLGPALLTQPPFAFASNSQDMVRWVMGTIDPAGWVSFPPLGWVHQLGHFTRIYLYQTGLPVGFPTTIPEELRGGSR